MTEVFIFKREIRIIGFDSLKVLSRDSFLVSPYFEEVCTSDTCLHYNTCSRLIYSILVDDQKIRICCKNIVKIGEGNDR